MTKLHKLSRRDFLKTSGLTVMSMALAACAPAQVEVESPVSNANEALQRLLEGNQRYVNNKSTDLNESQNRRTELASGQSPFATIFSCVDSRVPPELIFDRGLGDLFVIRTAGQVLDSAVLGSLQYGVAELKILLLVVLGHEKCGAVKATVEAVENNATVEAAKGLSGDLLDNAVKANVSLTVEHLKASSILSEAVEKGELRIVGARYDLDTGLVEVIG